MSLKCSLLLLMVLVLLMARYHARPGYFLNLPRRPVAAKGTYGYDAQFLRAHARKVLELHDEATDARVLLCADYQGRVMTSTAAGEQGSSYGWLNYELIGSGKRNKQFNALGGEERFWLGPEGGQFSLYFKQGDPFQISYWQVPAIIDTVAYKVQHADARSATFVQNGTLTNYSGTRFSFGISRSIALQGREAVEKKLHMALPAGVRFVAYESENVLENKGSRTWEKQGGLLSIWLLGMMTPSEETKVIIPFVPGQDARSRITDDYFGKISPDRLWVGDSVLYLRCDGKSRGKIGLSPRVAKPMVGSFDFKHNQLTLLIPEVHPGGAYVNSKWELQKDPYGGDVINSYNDGPLADGSQLGPFYEIESSSPVVELRPGQQQRYRQWTCHFEGQYEDLRKLAQHLLGVDLEDVKKW